MALLPFLNDSGVLSTIVPESLAFRKFPPKTVSVPDESVFPRGVDHHGDR